MLLMGCTQDLMFGEMVINIIIQMQAMGILQGAKIDEYQVNADNVLNSKIKNEYPDVDLTAKKDELVETYTFNSAANQISDSDQEWTKQDAVDMSEVNVQSRALIPMWQKEVGEVAKSIYEKGGISKQDAIDQATLQLKSTSETWKKLDGAELHGAVLFQTNSGLVKLELASFKSTDPLGSGV